MFIVVGYYQECFSLFSFEEGPLCDQLIIVFVYLLTTGAFEFCCKFVLLLKSFCYNSFHCSYREKHLTGLSNLISKNFLSFFWKLLAKLNSIFCALHNCIFFYLVKHFLRDIGKTRGEQPFRNLAPLLYFKLCSAHAEFHACTSLKKGRSLPCTGRVTSRTSIEFCHKLLALAFTFSK